MFISEQPYTRFESPSPARIPVPSSISSLAAVFAIALVLFVAMLTVAPAIARICPAPRAGTPIHLAR